MWARDDDDDTDKNDDVDDKDNNSDGNWMHCNKVKPMPAGPVCTSNNRSAEASFLRGKFCQILQRNLWN